MAHNTLVKAAHKETPAGNAQERLVPTIEAKANRLQKWHALAATYLGECFDAMDATIYFIALVPAMSELLKTKDATTIGLYGSIVLAVFMVGWALGSVLFGLVSDRFGRVKTMMWTILLYAGASGMCALAHNWQELAICRFFVGLGIGGEVSIGCVLLGEAWSGDRARKLWAMSFMQTSFGVGCILTGLFNLGSGEFGWRYLFLVGILPALITFYIRKNLKEPASVETMLEKRRTGVLANAGQSSLVMAFTGENRRRTITCTLMAASAIVGYWAGVSWIPAWINQLTGAQAIEERSAAMMYLSIGGIIGCFAVPYLVQNFGYKRSFQLSFSACLISTLGLFLTVTQYSPIVNVWTFAIGTVITIPFTLLVAYICDCFETQVLGTASGIAWGFGRIFAAGAGLATGPIIAYFGGSYGTAAACVELVYIVGIIAAFWAEDFSTCFETRTAAAGILTHANPIVVPVSIRE